MPLAEFFFVVGIKLCVWNIFKLKSIMQVLAYWHSLYFYTIEIVQALQIIPQKFLNVSNYICFICPITKLLTDWLLPRLIFNIEFEVMYKS